jgi:hypothetical protein
MPDFSLICYGLIFLGLETESSKVLKIAEHYANVFLNS